MTIKFLNPTLASNGTGSDSSPYNTFSGVTLAAGDKLLGVGGTTINENFVAGASGTSTAKIELGTYDIETSEQVTDGSQKFRIVGASSHGVNLGTRAHWNLVSLDIESAAGAFNAVNGLATDALTAHYITIDHCRLSSPGQNGAQLRGKGDRILYTEIFGCAQDALFLTVSDCEIFAFNIHDNDTALTAGDGIQFSGTHDHGTIIIRNGVIDHPYDSPKQCIITGGGTGTFIVLGNDLAGGAAVISMATPGAILASNRMRGASTRAVTIGATGISLIGNLIHDCPDGAIFDEAYAAFFYNNTFAEIVEDCIRHAYTGGSYTAKNNIFLRAARAHNGVSGVSAATGANIYHETTDYTGVTQTVEDTELSADPIIDALYRPRADSPCVGAGKQIPGVVLRDFDGKHWDGAVDIGARMYHAPRSAVAGRLASTRSRTDREIA